MSKRTKLCPFRKAVDRETNGITGKTVERERFQPCVGKKCMAYVYMTPFDDEASCDDICNWGCARIPHGLGMDCAWIPSAEKDETI